jgi:hypothetical protein
VLDFRLGDLHHDARGAAAQVPVAPVMLAEDAERLSDGFVKGLRGDVDGMLDALGIYPRRFWYCSPSVKERERNLHGST